MSHEFILKKLGASKFRSSFRLKDLERDILEKKGIGIIRQHAQDILQKRIGSLLDNDGRQTPLQGHPVFVAQHATATCCRKCLSKWHGLPLARELNENEIDYFVDLIINWISQDTKSLS